MKSARQIAFEILLKTEKNEAYSNLALDKALSISGMEQNEKSFASMLVYGTIEKRLTLDYNISLYLNSGINKLKNNVLVILRMGAYQLLFTDKVPKSAAVNESVKLAQNNNSSYAKSLCNAVLRKIAQNGLILPEESNRFEFLSIKYSVPEQTVRMFTKAYGEENALALLTSFNEKGDTYIRVNTTKITADMLIEKLFKDGVECEKTILPNALKLKKFGGNIRELESFKKGYFHVQDISSQLCIEALDPKPFERIIDLCSAPGGKAFTIQEKCENKGSVLAFDLYPSRTELIDEGAERLGLSITTCACDSSVYRDSIQKADRVLCDVPCSGLGVIRKKPEIRYKELDSFKDLPVLQSKMLKTASMYVKDKGRLVYSTCTLNKKENEKVCEAFLSENPDFHAIRPIDIKCEGERFYTLMPHLTDSDGFFFAVFEKS